VYHKLWEPAGDDPSCPASLADTLRLRTVVVQRALVDQPPVPPGWRVVDRTDLVTVLRRESRCRGRTAGWVR
jgi:hypothetical protein